VEGQELLKRISQVVKCVWIELIWLMTEFTCWFSRTQEWTSGFHERL